MGLFSSIFNPGSSAAKRVKAASASAQKTLDAALPEARALLSGGYDEAEGLIDTGYGNASDWLQTSYDDAFGQLGAGYDRAADRIQDGYSNADAYLVEGRDNAREVLDPWIASGRGAQDLYDTALGLGGQDAQSSFYEDYADNDPFRAYRDEMANKAIEQYYNARGLNTSGRGSLAMSRASLERGTQDLNSYLDRLERQGTRGGQYAGEAAALEERTGTGRANLSQRLGEVLGGNEVDRGTREANLTTQHGTNQSGLQVNRATAQANLRTGRGSDEANLVYGHAQQKAGNTINTANAVNQAKAVGKQNLLSGLSTVASAFIPGASGISLAGNIGNRLLGGLNKAQGNAYGDAGLGTWAPTITY